MTNRDLAKQLNVSPTALSMILNRKPGISEATRNRVIQQLTEMGYGDRVKKEVPSAHTEGNSEGTDAAPFSSGQICFAIYKRGGKVLDSAPYFLLLLEGLSQRAREYGLDVTLATIDGERADIARQLEKLNAPHIRGILLFATEMRPEDLEPFCQLNIPFVAMDHAFQNLPVNSVAIDNDMGTWLAVRYLASMGHRKIGYLKSGDEISSFQERAVGYQNASKAVGLELSRDNIFVIPYSEEGSYQAFRKILEKSPKLPTAFVTDDDTIATGVLRALLEANIRIPEDVSLIGFNDRPSCMQTTPPLTSVNVPRTLFASESVDLLVRLIRQKPDDEFAPVVKIRIGTRLVVRDSVYRLKDPKFV